MNIQYITLEEAENIHRYTIINSGGGNTGILDIGKLDSVLNHIQNDDYYPTFIDKLTHLFFSMCKYHCFVDGNKRIAITLSAMFLLKNGYMSILNIFFRNTENISYHVASGNIDKDLLHRILESIIDDTYDSDEELKLDIYNAIQKEI